MELTFVLANLLFNKQEIDETINRLGLHIDAKEWPELESVLAETVELDYRSLFGGTVETLQRKIVVARWQNLLTPLKTQHVITNLVVTIRPDSTADCAANVIATHARPSGAGEVLWTVGGRYDFRLAIEGGKWRISAIKLTVAWTTGNQREVLNPAAQA